MFRSVDGSGITTYDNVVAAVITAVGSLAPVRGVFLIINFRHAEWSIGVKGQSSIGRSVREPAAAIVKILGFDNQSRCQRVETRGGRSEIAIIIGGNKFYSVNQIRT